MHYLIISFTHKNTNIDTREKLSFNNDTQKEIFLKTILKKEYINGSILISTCNRVEIISSVKNKNLAKISIIEQLSLHSKIDINDLSNRANVYDKENAIHHLFSVVSSLDSLVIGETQIIGQVKDAFNFSLSRDMCSISLERALKYSFKCASKVRNETKIGIGSISIASQAVSQASKLFENQQNTKALVIGTGEMSTLAIKHLIKNDFNVTLISRDIKKARALAFNIQKENNTFIEICEYSKLNSLLNNLQLLITATSAPYPIIKNDIVNNCDFSRHWFDLAVPRDIGDINYGNLYIYSVDDLQTHIDNTIEIRISQAKKAFLIVSQMSEKYFKWLKTLEVEPIIKNLHLQGNKIINNKLKHSIEKGYINKENKENVKKLCETIISQFLHQPSKKLRNISKSLQSDLILDNIQSIFSLQDEFD